MDCLYNPSAFNDTPPTLVKVMASPDGLNNTNNNGKSVFYIYRLLSVDSRNETSSEPELETKV